MSRDEIVAVSIFRFEGRTANPARGGLVGCIFHAGEQLCNELLERANPRLCDDGKILLAEAGHENAGCHRFLTFAPPRHSCLAFASLIARTGATVRLKVVGWYCG